MCDRDGKGIVVARACGASQFVGTDCGDPLCPVCEPYRAAKRRKGWIPVAERMREPMWSIVSLPNDSDPGRGIAELMAARRKFTNFRLGKRNRVKLVQFCHSYNLNHFGEGEVEKRDRSVKRFITRVEALEAKTRAKAEIDKKACLEAGKPWKVKTVKTVRMYDLASEGFGTLEITYNQDRDDFHPHLNLVTDASYIPWVVLLAVWFWASDKRAEVFWVHRLSNVPEDMKEIVKYVTKAWEIPAGRQDDLRKALRGKRRIWPIGSAKPEKVKEPCPCCGKSDCACRFAGMGEILKRGKTSFGEVIRVRTNSLDDRLQELWFVKCHGVWKEPEPESLQSILRELARHSEPAPPKQFALTGWAAGRAG